MITNDGIMNLLTTCLLASALLSSVSQDVFILLKGDSFEVTLDSELNRANFISAKYDDITEKISFVTNTEINSILIFENDKVLFVLPVMADRVSIGKSMFESEHNYRLGFNFVDTELTYADMAMR